MTGYSYLALMKSVNILAVAVPVYRIKGVKDGLLMTRITINAKQNLATLTTGGGFGLLGTMVALLPASIPRAMYMSEETGFTADLEMEAEFDRLCG